jgi:uncharacterized repeat protein (TIGR02543 family)
VHDFAGRSAYVPAPDGKSPVTVQPHPFLLPGGIKKPVRPAALEALVKPVTGEVVADSITMPRLVLVQFQLENPSGEVTMNNAATSFELKIDGQPTHFYFWTYAEADGVATVTLRLEWPVEEGAVVTVSDTTVTVALDANGGEFESGVTTTTVDRVVRAPYGDLPTPSRSGYNFAGWYTAASGGSRVLATTTVPSTEDHTLYAHWNKPGGSGNSGGASGASISPTKASFDLNGGKDITVTITLNGNKFMGLKNGGTTLTEGTDYTLNGNTVTIKASYLLGLAVGTQTITFTMNGGGDPKLTITVSDNTPPTGELQTVTPTLPVNPFSDVLGTDWFIDDVIYAVSIGLINGKTPTTFAPNDDLTYAEAVKLAACMHQLHASGSVTLTNGSPWYQSYVDYAKANGIISGDYEWSAPATRAGYMEIFANALPATALQAINTIEDGAIPDVDMAHPQAAAIYKLYRAGIVQGVDAEHNCSPASNIKRREVAAILTRMMKESERIEFTL